MTTITLRNQEPVTLRLLTAGDEENLFQYLYHLSPESRSRFGPHPFNRETVHTICQTLPGDTHRFIAQQVSTGFIVAYFLVKQGMIDFDRERYAARQQYFNNAATVTYAPSVADAWQSTGLGTAMNCYIEHELSEAGVRTVILWGGVQATNEKAINYYKKMGYQYQASFWHDGKDNYDMLKAL
jgi:diamine N-acetyltransferase